MATLQAAFKPSETESPYRRLTYANLMAMCRYLILRARYQNLYSKGLFFMGSGADVRIDPTAQVTLGRSVQFMRDFTCHFAGDVRIADSVYFNRGCTVIALESLTIGEHTIFGERVSIHDENHVTRGTGPIHARGFTTAPITIGSNVWVGANATILQGVTIGNNAVIGAHAVVTHDVPAGIVAVGVPAHASREV